MRRGGANTRARVCVSFQHRPARNSARFQGRAVKVRVVSVLHLGLPWLAGGGRGEGGRGDEGRERQHFVGPSCLTSCLLASSFLTRSLFNLNSVSFMSSCMRRALVSSTCLSRSLRYLYNFDGWGDVDCCFVDFSCLVVVFNFLFLF